MKAFNLKKLGKLLGLLIVSALLFTSCGGEDGNTLPGPTPYAASTSYSASVASEVGVIATQVACANGGTRFRADFNAQGMGRNSTQVMGPFQNGSITGTLGESYLSRSAFGDFLVATKVLSGSQVVGFNISIHFCPASNIYTGEEILGPSVQISNLQSDNYGIILDSNTNCEAGNIDYARLWVQSSGTQYPIETVFAPYCQ